MEITCLEDIPPPDPDRVTAAKHVELLMVILLGGAEYRGLATLELPPRRRRTLDYMNGEGRFFALWTDARTRYINKLCRCSGVMASWCVWWSAGRWSRRKPT